MLDVSVELKNLEGLEWPSSRSPFFAIGRPTVELLCLAGGLTIVDGDVDVARDGTVVGALGFFLMVPPSRGDLCEVLLFDEMVVLG